MDPAASIAAFVAWVLVVFCIVCPPKYDPAIRWKERNEAKRNKQ